GHVGGAVGVSNGALNFNDGGDLSADSVTVSGGTLSVKGSLTAGTFTLSGGTLSGAGDGTGTGAPAVAGGGGSGAGHTRAQGGLTLSGAVHRSLSGRALDNAGAAVWSGSGGVFTSGGASFTNLAGASLDLQSDAHFVWNSGAAPTFTNQGTLKKSAGGGTSTFDGAFHNTGTVDVRSGTLLLNNGGPVGSGGSSSGSFTVAAGATLGFGGNNLS